MASRFWVGGTGTWDASDQTHWSSTSGPGNAPQSVPGSGDTVTFDANSGGGTVTVNHASLNIQSLTMSAFTGTLDFATNNNNITLNGANTGFVSTGSGSRILNMGNGTWTLSGAQGLWDCAAATAFTLNANGSTITWTGASQAGTRTFNTNGYTYNIVTLTASTGYPFVFSGNASITTLNITGKNYINFTGSSTTTVTTFNVTGTNGNEVLIRSSSNSAATVGVTSATIDKAAFQLMTFTGSPTAYNSFNIGSNTGITISSPSAGGARVIGG